MSEKELIEQDLDEIAVKQEEEQLKNLERYHWLKDNGYIIFETITGSQAHGTNTESSDIDKAFVYILPEDDILGVKYKEQLKIHKDFMGYEIRRFLELLRTANPTILELLNSPSDCILIKHHAFDFLLDQKEKFITKECENSFYGYARQQRMKAEGLEKLQNWEINRVTKKGPIDFCSVPVGYGFKTMTEWLAARNLDQMFCGLAAVDHCKDLYAVFYDYEAHKSFSKLVNEQEREEYRASKLAAGETMGFGYKGIAFEDSNDIRLSNIPKEERINGFLCHVSYNKDGYTKHCKDYKRYQNWLINRNENRWVEIQGHGQQIDGKNMMHFMRLVNIGKEIAEGKGIQIRRPDAQELLKIRRGEISLREMFDKSDIILNEMKFLFQNSNLPLEVSQEFIHNLLVKVRKEFYKFSNHECGFKKLHEFRTNSFNREDRNRFFVKKFGNLSELQYFISSNISEEINEKHLTFDDYYQMTNLSVVMNGFVYNSNRWPKTRNKNTGKIERVSLGRFSVTSFSRDKIGVICGAESQSLIKFDVVMWQDTLAAINVKFADTEEWTEGISKDIFFKSLGYELSDTK